MKHSYIFLIIQLANLFAFSQEAKLVLPIGHNHEIKGASFSPDGRRAVTWVSQNLAPTKKL